MATIYTVFGEDDLAVLAAQAALSVLSVLLAILLALRLSGSVLVGIGAGALLAIDPIQAAAGAQLATETLSTLLVTLTAYAGVRFVQSEFSARWGVLYGAALVAATFVRPTTFYFPILVLGVLVVVAATDRRRRRALIRGAVAFFVPCVLLLGSWNVRNAVEVGSWRFSSIEAINLYWYRAADVVAKEEGLSFQEARVRLTDRLNRGAVPKFDYEEYKSGQLPPAWSSRQGEYYDRAHRAALDILLSNPLETGGQFARGIYSQLIQSGWGDSLTALGLRSVPQPIQGIGLLFVWSVEALALFGAVLSFRRGGTLFWAHVLTIALPLYTIIVSAGAEAAAGWRFRIPTWPILAVYAVIGLQQVGRYLQKRHRDRQASVSW